MARKNECHHANMVYFTGHDVPLLWDTEGYSPSENTKFSQYLSKISKDVSPNILIGIFFYPILFTANLPGN